MKRILMIAATPFFSDRGCHIRIYNEIKYLNKNNIEVILCTYHLGYNPPGIKEENIKRIINIPWYKKITPGASWHKIYLDFLLLLISIKEYLKIKPKIIHAHLYEGLLIACIVKIISFFRVKIIFDCQGSLAEEMFQYTLRKNKIFKIFYFLFYFIEKILLVLPDKIVCSSENSYKFLTEKYSIKLNKIEIINDGVDEEIFNNIDNSKKELLKNKLNIPKNNIIIIYTGSITKAKGVDKLLDSLPEVLSKKSDLTFIFLGYGDLENLYKNKYKKFISNRNIIFTGRVNYFELPIYLSIADYAIDPKKNSSESSGKLFNYLFSNLQVICFRNTFNKKIKNRAIYINNFKQISLLNSKKEGLIFKYNFNKWSELIDYFIKNYNNLFKIRIGIDCRCLSIPGGVKNYAINLIKNLLEIDSEYEYYLFYNNKKFLGTFKNKNVIEICINFNIPILYFVWDQLIIAYLCLIYKINIIHGLKNSVPVLTNAKRIVTIHDIIPVLFPKTMKWHHSQYWKLVFFLISKIKTEIIFISNTTKNDFKKIYKTKNKLDVIYLGVNFKNNLKQDIINHKENYILYVGSLEPRKNIPKLIEAFNIFLKTFSNYKLYLVGKSGWEDININININKFNLENKVIKTGYISDNERDKLYLKSKVFIYISLYEGFGLPILEAMKNKLPVIASNTNSISEISNNASILVDPNDEIEISNKLVRIVADNSLKKLYINRGLENIKNFSWKNCAMKTLKIYE